MTIQGLIVILLIGAIAGWLAGQLMKGAGFGLIGNIVVGIVGAFVAGLVLPGVGLTLGGGIIGSIVSATIGAIILLVIVTALALLVPVTGEARGTMQQAANVAIFVLFLVNGIRVPRGEIARGLAPLTRG